MSDIYIVGVGMTPFGRYLDRPIKEMTRAVVTDALADAGADVADIEAAWFSNAAQAILEGQGSIPGEIALRNMGIQEIPVTNVENACASASTALDMAATWLEAGRGGVALAVGAEKMFHEDRAKMFSVFDGGWDVHDVEAATDRLLALGQGVADPDGEEDTGQRSVFMDVYAALAKFHMKSFGTTQAQLAAVAAKNHAHSAHNPLSQYREAMTVDEVMAGRKVSWPLTLPMCSPISDGAAAAIICREEELDRFDRSRAVKIHATALRTGSDRDPQEFDRHVTHLAARDAYERAGLGPDDMDVAEVHDATAFAEIQQVENLGFCDFGAGGALTESGATSIGGRIPVNPSGGLESKGHPVGATGLAQVFELTTQLRGEAGGRQVSDAKFAIAENGGGFHGIEEAVACVTILGRD
ncbi:MAG: thiolase family protein [Rhodospirillaceae bacterium]|jgi:acetyl-CoA acetyltransferase|nr:thiolase family protein [Rhodospirillaceae bacterium]MBT6402950.1 thiolase family protein [Rhodospirillaceae bacterium]MBT6537027.1 thiolase family protein [Rhodospirillaceae bacterium]MBT7362341.1 thiolase family protein [Rhodospirillaceae bacterium]